MVTCASMGRGPVVMIGPCLAYVFLQPYGGIPPGM
jgi:hypothetical protein